MRCLDISNSSKNGIIKEYIQWCAGKPSLWRKKKKSTSLDLTISVV